MWAAHIIHSLSGAFPTSKARILTKRMFASLSTQYAQLRIKGAGLSVVQYFDYTFKNLNGIRDTTLSKRLLVPKHRLNVNRIMTSWIWTNALPILSFLNENYFTASIQSSELFVFCTTRNDLRKRRHECVLALDSYSEVEQMSQTISLSIMSVTISPIILFQLYSPSVPIPHRLQIGFS